MNRNLRRPTTKTYTEMGIYRNNLSAIVIGDVIAQNSFDLSITDIAFVIHIVIAYKLSR